MNALRLACARSAPMLRRVPVARSWPPALGPPQARSLVCVAASQQTQPKLTSAEKKALRTKSQRQNDSLVVVNCGANGLSQPFLEGLYDALRRNQMVKVRMGCSRQEKKDKEAEIEQRLDCVLIHSIGSTSIFFRQKGLSKPRGLSFTGGVVGDIGDEQYRDGTDADRIPGKKGRGEKDVAAAVAAERPEFKILR